MQHELAEYISQARERNLSNEEIRHRLVTGGWPEADVNRALSSEDDLVVPPPPTHAHAISHESQPNTDPISVVSNLSTRGFEYGIMFVSLWAVTGAVLFIVQVFIYNSMYKPNDLYNYYRSSPDYAFPVTVLLVTVPIFTVLFLRLKRAELARPALKRDPSRRRMSHITQFLAFVTCVGFLIYFVYRVLNGEAAGTATSTGMVFAQTAATLAIVGSVFAYYWIDEHRAAK